MYTNFRATRKSVSVTPANSNKKMPEVIINALAIIIKVHIKNNDAGLYNNNPRMKCLTANIPKMYPVMFANVV